MLYEYEEERSVDNNSVDFDSILDDLAVLQSTIAFDAHHGGRATTVDSEQESMDELEENKPILKRRRLSSKTTVRQPKPEKVKVSRFFVQDIRKCYSKMMQNVMNTSDFTLLYGFLETFFGPHPEHTTTKYLKGSPEKVFTMTFYGLNEVAKYLYCFMNMSPDNIFLLNDATVQHTTGKLISTMKKVSTHIFEDPPAISSYYAPYIWADGAYNSEHRFFRDANTNEIMVGKVCDCNKHHHSDSRSLHSSDEMSLIENKRNTMREIMRSVDLVVSHLPLRNPPQSVGADGTLIISTDVNRLISKMELNIIY